MPQIRTARREWSSRYDTFWGIASLLPQLADYLTKAMSLRVYIGDPWARVVYPEALKPVLNQIGSRFGVSVGLAMRDID